MAGIKGSISGIVADVLAASRALHSRPMADDNSPLAKADAAVGSATNQALISAGVEQGTRSIRHMATDLLGRQSSAQQAVMFHDANHSSAALNTGIWQQVATTLTATQSAQTGKILNAANGVAINTGIILKSYKRFKRPRGTTLQATWRARTEKYANGIIEMGFGDGGAAATGTPTGIADQTVGWYWRFSSAGTLVPVCTFGGVDAATGVDVSSLVTLVDAFDYSVSIDDAGAKFMLVDGGTGVVLSEQRLKMPDSQLVSHGYPSISFIAGVRYGAVAGVTATKLHLGDVVVCGLNLDLDQPYGHLNASLERGMIAAPGSLAQLAQHVNSAAPANGTLSNTTAAYASLGGRFAFLSVAGAETDYTLFAIQNTDALSGGMTYYCTGLIIESAVGGAAAGAGLTLLDWFAYTGNTASLADTSARRLPLGLQSFAASAPIGALANRIQVNFSDAAIPCHPMRFFGIGLRIPVGQVAASQVFRGIVTPIGYWA